VAQAALRSTHAVAEPHGERGQLGSCPRPWKVAQQADPLAEPGFQRLGGHPRVSVAPVEQRKDTTPVPRLPIETAERTPVPIVQERVRDEVQRDAC
jgi:hypothetical protein